ncbi:MULTISPECIES: C40 family peptidase [Bacillus cereus group]|uniref:NlpC/P60 domain-containing protein n=1 Tax=Bacillus thuringiensis subsp. jegathesan TaxID=56955 RepID=A0A9X6ML27_BACTJ|nr:C40 family peptidase [Bacillus thuringiensis]OUB76854.1 hypothetical protein BK750_02995 [Bacillus thuringiensis serovar jegathesan]
MKRKYIALISALTFASTLSNANVIYAEEKVNIENTPKINAEEPVANKIEEFAKKYMGLPYIFGGEDPNVGLDCSSFTRFVLKQVGINLPRTAAEQFASGKGIPTTELRKGDLVFFETYKAGPSHVGIYLENGNFIHEGGTKVHISNLSNPYYKSRYLGARKFINNDNIVPSVVLDGNNTTIEQETKQTITIPKKIEDMPKSFNVTPNGVHSKYPITIGDTLERNGKKIKNYSLDTNESTSNNQNEDIDSTNVMEKLEETIAPASEKQKQLQIENEIQLFNYGHNTFLPTPKFESITMINNFKLNREEIAVILETLINKTKNKSLLNDKPLIIKDVMSEDPYYKSIQFVLSHNFLTTNSKSFEPKRDFTQEEATILIQNLSNHPYIKLTPEDLNYVKANEANPEFALNYFYALAKSLIAENKPIAQKKVKENVSLEPIEKLALVKKI